MTKFNYSGMPSIVGKSTEDALAILFQHCQDVAENMMAMEQELKELQVEVARLRDIGEKGPEAHAT